MTFVLTEDGHTVTCAASGPDALRALQTGGFPVMVTDLKMPGFDGMTLLRKALGLDPDVLVIVITAFGDMATAVAAMKAGAFDFLPKPCDRDHFQLTVRRAAEHARLRREVRELRGGGASAGKLFIFVSAAMAELLARADRVAASDATVLIEGESGTGKELVARRLHRASHRAGGPFVPINCGAIPRELLESELFGHARGAFTGATQDRRGRFQQAEGGTLFLDEIAELPLELQSRLLRVIQEKVMDPVGADRPVPLNVRVVAATNRPLEALVRAGQFRQDLYFRLNVVPLSIPPLRERPEDILPLARHFLAQHGGGRQWHIPPAVARRLAAMPWPGNARELENLCHRAALLSDEPVLGEELLAPPPADATAPLRIAADTIALPPEGISLVALEKAILLRALEMNGYNQSSTARFLRIPRHILLYRMEKFDISGRGTT
ncbi:MAG: sigma-54-dependent Fis family transcriptional regulator [Candidatus Schekmanbacteria bacterium]|nr:sigma-54-dependent Fis family transcriptional regulator [Candidatus Schekmanbacteria bacterium]